MPTPRLPMRKIREVLRLKHDQGLSHRAVAQACSLGVGTVTLYLQRAIDRGVSWPVPAELDDAALEARLFPRAAPLRDRVRPDCAEIHRELTRVGVTLLLLWQEYAQTHPVGYRYSQFCAIYRQWARRLRPSMRQVHRVGEKTFINFSGKRPTIVDRHTGEERPVELFVAVLGASRFTYAEATLTQQLPDWVGAHTRMVEYFGGSTGLWVPDQLKSAITRACRYEPGINRTYEELAAHYGAVVVSGPPAEAPRQSRGRKRCPPRPAVDPRPAAPSGLLQSRRPESRDPDAARRAQRPSDATARGQPPHALCAARPPGVTAAARYVLAHWTSCRVNIDYHVQLERHVYSVPYQLIHELVEARYTTTTVALYYNGRRVTSHRPTLRRPAVDALGAHAPRPPGACRVDPVAAHPLGRAHGAGDRAAGGRDPAPPAAPRAGLSCRLRDHAPGPTLRRRPPRRRQRAGPDPPLVSLSHGAEHARLGPGPPAAGGAGRGEPTDAHPRQHPGGGLLRPDHTRGGPMLIEQTLDKLHAMKLGAMAEAVQQQLRAGDAATLSFEERLGLLVDTEWTAREQRKLTRRLQTAKLRYAASLEAVDFTHSRRLHRQQVLTLGSCAWITDHHNLLITGPTGIGKSFLACAFVERACRRGLHGELPPDGSGLASERYLSTLHSRGIPTPSTRADAPCRSCLDRPQFYALVASFRTTIPDAQNFRGQRESP